MQILFSYAILCFIVWGGWSLCKRGTSQERQWAMERNVDCASIIKRKYAHTGMEIETPWTRRSSRHFVASSLFHQKFTLQNAFGVKVKYSGVCVYDVKKNTVKLNVVRGWHY